MSHQKNLKDDHAVDLKTPIKTLVNLTKLNLNMQIMFLI